MIVSSLPWQSRSGNRGWFFIVTDKFGLTVEKWDRNDRTKTISGLPDSYIIGPSDASFNRQTYRCGSRTSEVPDKVVRLHAFLGFDVRVMQIRVQHDDCKRQQKHGVRTLELLDLVRVTHAVPTGKGLINKQWNNNMSTTKTICWTGKSSAKFDVYKSIYLHMLWINELHIILKFSYE